MVSRDILHHYRRIRAHQMATYSREGGVVDERGRCIEPTGGGAAYGFHAYAAFLGAKRHLRFAADLKKTVAADKRRRRNRRKGNVS